MADKPEDEIGRLRAEIDRLDGEIVRLIGERAAHAAEIGRLKGDGPVYRPEREAEVLRRVAAANRGPLPAESVKGIFAEIISACRALEGRSRVGYLGPQGTFSERPWRSTSAARSTRCRCASIDEAFRQAETGATHFAVVPVENSTEGAIGRTLDLLLNTPLRICGEVVLRVHQNLMAKGDSLTGRKRVYSHAQSLAQCQRLARPQPAGRRARTGVEQRRGGAPGAPAKPEACAIGPAIAAERYGLTVLAQNIEDEPQNLTRFLVLGNVDPGPSGRDLTSLVMSAPNRPGAVHALLDAVRRSTASA